MQPSAQHDQLLSFCWQQSVRAVCNAAVGSIVAHRRVCGGHVGCCAADMRLVSRVHRWASRAQPRASPSPTPQIRITGPAANVMTVRVAVTQKLREKIPGIAAVQLL